MKNVLIVYESRTGNTEAMSQAVLAGALASGANVVMKRATEAVVDDLMNCDAVIFGSPNNFGYITGTLKEYLDQIYISLGNKSASKLYAAFSTGAVGAKPSLNSIDHICQEFGQFGKFSFEKAAEGISAKGKPTADILDQCKELGKTIADL